MPNQNPTKRPPAPPGPLPGIPVARLPRRDPAPDSAPVAAALPRARVEAEPPSVAPQTDQAIGRIVRLLWGKAWPALVAAALGTGGAVVARPAAPPARVDAQGVELAETRRVLRDTRDELAETRAQVRALRTWAAEQQAWQLSLLERQGVRVRRGEGQPPTQPIDATVPLRAPGRFTAGPSLEVSTPPPTPP